MDWRDCKRFRTPDRSARLPTLPRNRFRSPVYIPPPPRPARAHQQRLGIVTKENIWEYALWADRLFVQTFYEDMIRHGAFDTHQNMDTNLDLEDIFCDNRIDDERLYGGLTLGSIALGGAASGDGLENDAVSFDGIADRGPGAAPGPETARAQGEQRDLLREIDSKLSQQPIRPWKKFGFQDSLSRRLARDIGPEMERLASVARK